MRALVMCAGSAVLHLKRACWVPGLNATRMCGLTDE